MRSRRGGGVKGRAAGPAHPRPGRCGGGAASIVTGRKPGGRGPRPRAAGRRSPGPGPDSGAVSRRGARPHSRGL